MAKFRKRLVGGRLPAGGPRVSGRPGPGVRETIQSLQADLLFPYSKKNYHAVLFETKVDLHVVGNNMVSSENQYPVFRGLAE